LRKKENRYNEIESLISPGVTISGEINSQGSIRVDGKLEGTIDIKGNLVLGEKGKIKGEVKAANVMLAGKIEGNVIVSERFEISHTGVMVGDVSSRIITIEEGGMLQGTSKMSSANSNLSTSEKKGE